MLDSSEGIAVNGENKMNIKGPNQILDGFGYYLANLSSWMLAGLLVSASVGIFIKHLSMAEHALLGITLGYTAYLAFGKRKAV